MPRSQEQLKQQVPSFIIGAGRNEALFAYMFEYDGGWKCRNGGGTSVIGEVLSVSDGVSSINSGVAPGCWLISRVRGEASGGSLVGGIGGGDLGGRSVCWMSWEVSGGISVCVIGGGGSGGRSACRVGGRASGGRSVGGMGGRASEGRSVCGVGGGGSGGRSVGGISGRASGGRSACGVGGRASGGRSVGGMGIRG